MCVKRTVAPDSYIHLGVERNLLKIVDVIKKLHKKEIVFYIGIDDLPLFKSSSVRLWPILARIVNMPMINVFLLGNYVGIQKPHDIKLFLHDFVKEMKNLIKSGFKFETYNIKIKIRAFLCDALAQSFVCVVKGHNALNECNKCDQIGKSVMKVTTFLTSVGKLRSDEDFRQRIDQNFHHKSFLNREMSLESIGIKMITQFPLDVMLLIDLGVTKKNVTNVVEF
ncbi:hypothetical protein CVS40_12021 [Lucilia cuprina]|nr:hypothetical protein CVS40_12021 [Lucilia cuprina]